jgi:hypothetical protein
MKKDKTLKLTAQNVDIIFTDCLFKEEEIFDGKPIVEYKIAEGVKKTFGFHSERLNGHAKNVSDLIDQLPNLRDGQSFLNLCVTNEGILWGEHSNVEQLISLGVALGQLNYVLPKKYWKSLPGGLPYVINSVEKELNKNHIK